ncbi:MAG: L-serine ammonia-lyase, iron-sulfur-dependent, subunit alpha [Desulfobacterales bacterium]|jgi:L-serine dehydratase|nr:L-serine ammonia-lyase, iron-sulfur-dependent, subunit alpha [Desulfobacterales bacterium]
MASGFPSIFNDVIGPVMRGPSSSHCAAALRIGRLARDLMGGRIARVLMEFDAKGSLAFTHASQGSDMGFFGGLMGWDAQDERLLDSAAAARAAGIEAETRIADFGDPHPNTYRLTLSNPAEKHTLVALSTGGGMVEVVAVDQVPLSVKGDYFETLVATAPRADDIGDPPQAKIEEISVHRGPEFDLVQIQSRAPLPDSVLAGLAARPGVRWVKVLAPVLPILSRRQPTVPFITCAEMLAYRPQEGLDLGRLALRYESARGGIPEEEVFRRMGGIVRTLQASVAAGLAGTAFEDRILGFQSGGYLAAKRSGRLLDAGLLDAVIACVSSLMEVKSAMGVIVAAPTAGACGALPGAVIGAAGALQLDEDEMTRALLAAGMIGVFICARSTFAAEVCGCMAECGSAAGMAAAALATLAGASARQAVDAASMALQNTMGLVCDPVAGRVEVPCLGKNVLAAANALACANMALAGFDAVIPLDEVIAAMDRTGRSLPMELRCTGLGGLSLTPAAKRIEAKLARPDSGA